MITIKVEASGLEKVDRVIASLSGPQMDKAYVDALNDVGFKLRPIYQNEMREVFDKPTPYITNSVLVNRAREDRLYVEVGPTYMGGKGVDPKNILAAQVAGGQRKDKRSEVAMKRVGILPDGYQTAIPKDPYPGSDDGKGNIRGPFLVQLLSYLQAFGEQGYKANMTAKRKAKLENASTTNGFKKINGVAYFVSYGRLRDGRTKHLAPGIWAKTGTGGADIKPVLMFVKEPSYRIRLDLVAMTAKLEDPAELFAKRLRYQLRRAAGV